MSGGKRYSAIILRTLFSAVVFSSSFGQNDSGTLDAGAVTIPVSAPDPEGQLIEEPAPLREEDAVQSGDRETTPDAALTSIVSQQQQSNKDNVTIAVNTLLAKGMDKESADLLSERLRVEMVKTGSFNVMERAQMEEIFQEQSFQQSDVCNEQSCIVEMVQLLGVERIIAGTVGKIGRMYTFSLKMINVRTGQIMYTVDEDCDCPIEQTLTVSTKNIAQKLSSMVRKERFGGVKISSTPTGALVFINNTKVGATPWNSTLLLPGQYTMELNMPSYDSIKETFSVKEGEIPELSYELHHTDRYMRQKYLKNRLIRRISFGGFAVACGGAGGIFEILYRREFENRETIGRQYAVETAYLERQRLKAEYDSATERVNSFNTWRYVFYSLGALGAGGFVVSLKF
jgi:PBP1b-binding outer membrane lipoprotein LpoB